MKRIIFILSLFFSLTAVSQTQPLNWFNANKFGCYGDGLVLLAKASMTSGSATLTSSVGTFKPTDVGKSVRVQGAGTSNVDLVTTISAYSSATVVTLSANAGATVSARNFDYGTDNTARIQALFAYVVSKGGGKAWFPRGQYQLYGALQTSINSVNPNCQIYIPLTNPSSTSIVQMEVEGEYANQVLAPISATDFANVQQNATIFKSEINGSGTLPAVFGTPYFFMTDVGTNYNYTSVRMKNIIIQTKSQINDVEVASTMSGINANYINQFSIENAVVMTESLLYSTATQASSTTYGIIFPYFLNNAVSQADRLIVTGYHWGYYTSDHFDAGQITAVFCYYALKYENGTPGNINFRGHDAIIKHLQVELCPKGINVTGESGLHVNLYSGERDASGQWYQTTGNDVDFTGSGISGTVTIDHLDMTNAGVPDYAITSNDYSRFKLYDNNGHKVDDFTQPLVDGSSVTWNLIKGKRAILTLTQNTALSITGYSQGDRISLEVNQDGTGGRTLSITNNSYSNTGTFVPNPSPASSSYFEGVYDGNNFVWQTNNVTALASNSPATNFISTLILAGYTPGGTEQSGYAAFYSSAVSHGYWSKLKALYPFASTTATTQQYNFVNTALYPLTSTGTITRTAGFQPDGSTGYANTGIVPSAVLTSNNAALSVWQTVNSTLSFASTGSFDNGTPAPHFDLFFNYDGTHSGGAVNDDADFVSVTNPGSYIGLFTISRTASNAQAMYQNGSSIGTNTSTTSVGLPTHAVLIGARMDGGGGIANKASNNYIFVVVSDGLTSTDAGNLYTDLSALKTAMGR